MSWAELFERAEDYDASVEDVEAALAARRGVGATDDGRGDAGGDEPPGADGDDADAPEDR